MALTLACARALTRPKRLSCRFVEPSSRVRTCLHVRQMKKALTGLLHLAEREGFEPSIRYRIHTFQACSFSRSDTSPFKTVGSSDWSVRTRRAYRGGSRDLHRSTDAYDSWRRPTQPHLGTRISYYRCSLPGLAGFTTCRCEGTGWVTIRGRYASGIQVRIHGEVSSSSRRTLKGRGCFLTHAASPCPFRSLDHGYTRWSPLPASGRYRVWSPG